MALMQFGLMGQAPRIAASLKYGEDGKFKILQFTDTHYIVGDERSERALGNVIEMLDTEKPDFVNLCGLRVNSDYLDTLR